MGSAEVQGVLNSTSSTVAYSFGEGNAYSVTYLFYIDTEIVFVPNEPRVATIINTASEENKSAVVPNEPRIAIVAEENRVFVVPAEMKKREVPAEERTATEQNRLRRLR